MRQIKTIGVIVVGLIASAYLLNPGAGVFELIPDNLPIIGNLDEAGAVLLLIQCLKHFGIARGRPDKQQERKQV